VQNSVVSGIWNYKKPNAKCKVQNVKKVGWASAHQDKGHAIEARNQ